MQSVEMTSTHISWNLCLAQHKCSLKNFSWRFVLFLKQSLSCRGVCTPHHLSLHRAARSRYAFMFTNDRNLVKLVKNLLYFRFPTEVFDKTCVPIFFFNKSLFTWYYNSMNCSCSLSLLIETLDICIDGIVLSRLTLQQRPRQTEPTADSPAELPHCSITHQPNRTQLCSQLTLQLRARHAELI